MSNKSAVRLEHLSYSYKNDDNINEEDLTINDVNFDIYEGEQVGEGKKSVAFALTFRAKDRTLADTEINEIMEKILAELTKLGANLRQ